MEVESGNDRQSDSLATVITGRQNKVDRGMEMADSNIVTEERGGTPPLFASAFFEESEAPGLGPMNYIGHPSEALEKKAG